MKRRVGSDLVDTGAFILTFELKTLPEKLRVSMYTCTVRPYIPAPMKCFKSQRFGHTSHRCEGVDTCGDYGKNRHEGEACTHHLFVSIAAVNIPQDREIARNLRRRKLSRRSRSLTSSPILKPGGSSVLWLRPSFLGPLPRMSRRLL